MDEDETKAGSERGLDIVIEEEEEQLDVDASVQGELEKQAFLPQEGDGDEPPTPTLPKHPDLLAFVKAGGGLSRKYLLSIAVNIISAVGLVSIPYIRIPKRADQSD
jgi:hypothetical protein